jgi:hypothetical protein
MRPPTAPAMPAGTGIKQRLRYRFADAGRWPIDVALYGEVTENDREIELEAKVTTPPIGSRIRYGAVWARTIVGISF